MTLPAISPDARRRRLTTLINAMALAQTSPALFIVDDAQWIDAVSETMLAAYRHAIAAGYRFYSYGDASLLHPEAVR